MTGGISELLPFSDLQAIMDCDNCIGGLFVSSRIRTPYALILTRIVGSNKVMVANVPTGAVIKLKLTRSGSFPIVEKNRLFNRAMMNIEPSFQLISKTISLGVKALLGSVGLEMTRKIIIKRFVESIENGTELPVTAEEGREVVRATNMLHLTKTARLKLTKKDEEEVFLNA